MTQVSHETILTWAALGGFTGLVTFAFTVWDRLLRNRPLAWIVAKLTGSTPFEFLRLSNVANSDILVIGLKSSSPGYQVAEVESVEGAARAAVGDAPLAIVKRGEHFDFPLFLQDKKAVGKVTFTVYWRKASSTWFPRIPKRVFTSFGDIDRIKKARLRLNEAQ